MPVQMAFDELPLQGPGGSEMLCTVAVAGLRVISEFATR